MRRTTYILLFLILTFAAFALDVKDFTFSHIGVQEGITNQRVYSVAKTTDGAVWWTTKIGVGRTNGARVDNYSLGDITTYDSFAGRVIMFASYADSTLQDSLFVYDNKGRIFRYDQIQNTFVQRYDVSLQMGKDICVESVLATKTGYLIGMREGLYWWQKESGELVEIKKGPYVNAVMPVKDADGNTLGGMVLITLGKELMLATLTEKGLEKDWKCIYTGYVNSSYYDSKAGTLWLGTLDSGVKHAAFANGKLQDTVWTDVPGVPKNPVRSIVPYEDNTLLFGVDGYGVYQTDKSRTKIEEASLSVSNLAQTSAIFHANEGRNGVLHGNGVYGLLVDDWGDIIIGTYSGGVDIARPVGSTTAIFQHVVNSSQSISNDHVNCVKQSDATHLMMGTDNGLSIFDGQNSEWSNVAQGVVVLDICKTPSNGKTLLATYGNGVCEIGGDGKAHTIYSKAGGQLQDDHVYSLLYDQRGSLWMGVLYGNLTEMTPSGEFRYYEVNHVQALTELHDGRIAVGSEFGLYIIDPNTKVMKKQEYTVEGCDVVNTYILDVYEDESGNIWLATDGGGVYVYNMKTEKCFQITMNNGLPSNTVCSIIKDNYKNTSGQTGGKTNRIWFATEKGLAFIYPPAIQSQQEASKIKVVDVNYCNGICTEYIRGAVCNLENGHILLGTIEGARIVDPQHLQEINYTAPLRILRVEQEKIDSTDLYSFNEKVAMMLKREFLELNYSQRTFNLYFESINMRNHSDIAYQYKIGDDEWSEPSQEEYIHFVNLEPGVHQLYIRCVSKTGGAVLDEKHLEILIHEPWWNSWWMWCIYLILLVCAFYGAWKVYDLHARYNNIIRERIAALPEISPQRREDDIVQHDDIPSSEATADDVNTETAQQDSEVSQEADPPQTESPETSEFVNKATYIVLANLSDSDFTIDDLCREIGLSRTLFYVKVKSYTGKSPQDFVRMIRLEKAAALLKQGRTVGDVASVTGFENPKYFSVVFKKYFGTSPSQYKG